MPWTSCANFSRVTPGYPSPLPAETEEAPDQLRLRRRRHRLHCVWACEPQADAVRSSPVLSHTRPLDPV